MFLLDFYMVYYTIIPMKPTTILPKFNEFLKEKGLTFEAVCIGGAALALLGVITRETRDCDIISPEIPKDIEKAAQEFAIEMESQGFELRKDWLNNGPSSLVPDLPKDWAIRVQVIFDGENLKLFSLGRPDLLKTKLFALCDRDIDLGDCLLLKPTATELKEALAWVQQRDAHPKWPHRVETVFQNLAKRLGYEF